MTYNGEMSIKKVSSKELETGMILQFDWHSFARIIKTTEEYIYLIYWAFEGSHDGIGIIQKNIESFGSSLFVIDELPHIVKTEMDLFLKEMKEIT